MKKSAALILAAVMLALEPARAQEQPPLLPQPTVEAIAQELSGETAKRNLEYLARLHRQRGSRQFHAAAEFVASVNGGNQTVPTLKFADGSTLTNPSGAEVKAKLAS